MDSSSSLQKRPVKSWLGLCLGLLFAGMSIDSYVEFGRLHSLFSVLAFLTFTYPWSQLISFKEPSPMTRTTTLMTYAALLLLAISLILRFFG